MQYKTFSSLIFATAALAAPASSADNTDGLGALTTGLPPSSVIAVLVTAIPTTWLNEYETDSAFQSSVLNAYEHGSYPAWASSLPADVISWASSEGITGLTPLATNAASTSGGSMSGSLGGASSTSASTGVSPKSTSPSMTATSTAVQTGASSTASGSLKTSSGSSTSTASSSTSTGGAPAATGGIAMSLAGAAGALGLALAL
ncbi:hypothetical protein N7539_000535 [Penicillium diatomitis]|uniref:Peptidase A1 domain-containing protein n=1 Tax=Penicillium diatomitis TaxID=2819901 RepID=A0A9W9XLZ9_9EURO|nr:uncharacterized protein N7539_000535 [Penicillium diatomitis]KAJ5495419.1 hypothetical protein N7539_000535 [Penicillium diatomitis]